MAEGFITNNQFQESSNRVINWGDLPTEVIYRVDSVKHKTISRDGKDVQSKYAVLVGVDGGTKKVWLTSIIEQELMKYKIGGEDKIYIQSLGLKSNKSGTRKYYDFDLVKK